VNGTVLPNGTLSGGAASHVGQIFFDQDLISDVEATAPYSTNTQDITLNADDSILAEEANTTDPIVNYVLLGDTVEDGILSWMTIGIDPSSSYNITAAATYGENGGLANSDSSQFGPGGAPPSGAVPSGSVPTGSLSGSVSASATFSA
jgi:hypothetical protein